MNLQPANIVRVLSEIEALLCKHKVSYVDELRRIQSEIARGQDNDLEGVLLRNRVALFGGMGSLSDVYISKLNGDIVDDEDAANKELSRLRKALWKEVGSLYSAFRASRSD